MSKLFSLLFRSLFTCPFFWNLRALKNEKRQDILNQRQDILAQRTCSRNKTEAKVGEIRIALVQLILGMLVSLYSKPTHRWLE